MAKTMSEEQREREQRVSTIKELSYFKMLCTQIIANLQVYGINVYVTYPPTDKSVWPEGKSYADVITDSLMFVHEGDRYYIYCRNHYTRGGSKPRPSSISIGSFMENEFVTLHKVHVEDQNNNLKTLEDVYYNLLEPVLKLSEMEGGD